MPTPLNTTVAIIGGGPAGATLASYLGQAGIDHIVIERDPFPRHHIGESLIGATTEIFHEIGLLDQLEAAPYVDKRGAVWVPATGRGSQSIKLAPPPQFGLDHTYHVDRASFDKLLLDHAVSKGTRLLQPAKVTGLLHDDTGRLTGLTVRQTDGATVDLHADLVIDASGQATVLGTKLGLKQNDPAFDQVAHYAYYENVDLGPADHEERDYIHIYFLPAPRAWVWQIPVSDTVTSIGVVTRHGDFKAARADGLSVEDYFNRAIATNPAIARRMDNARRTADDFRSVGNYSFSMSKIHGPGFALVGDASRFVDPIFSSGISIAMHGARAAAAAIKDIVSGEQSEPDALAAYAARMKKGTDVWYQFITLYYKVQNLFTYYIQKPDYRDGLIDLLQGKVYDDSATELLANMRADIETIENDPTHLLHKALVHT